MVKEPRNTTIINVPTINDELFDFHTLFRLVKQSEESIKNQKMIFKFDKCNFLRQNAVAYLGGLARLINYHNGEAVFYWESIVNRRVFEHLKSNGFISIFLDNSDRTKHSSVPYCEDLIQNKDGIISYLKTEWLGKGWINISNKLKDAISGTVWEIYTNAFEYANSPIGIFSCGQHYPKMSEIKLTVMDFGVGIPHNVRNFLKNDPKEKNLTDGECLKWAFQKGTTTSKKNNISRGLGLDLLKEFVKVNNGKIEIFSNHAYGIINKGKEDFMDNAGLFHNGTIFNITFICDASHYLLSSEKTKGQYF
ncbi:ATP-binding region ATPase domain-containing protein [Candidatus Magnetoovum chiemensis]|nr:ATP-binding region ATPase domain-containing protein [Candidatus Magnetoovum chiemensis]